MKVLAPQLHPTVCDPIDCRPLSSSVHGILQVRILEWVAIFVSRLSSPNKNQMNKQNKNINGHTDSVKKTGGSKGFRGGGMRETDKGD